ncbi:MAG: IS3 family transposase [Pseudomonadales bacterium]|nr:IS3 family transposase [Pseudomonadales bacterium]
MYTLLGVSSSGYYDWHDRPESRRAERHRRITNTKKIERCHRASKEIYSSPRVHEDLVEGGERIGVNTVANLMQRSGIQSKVHKRFVVTTHSRHGRKAAGNLLDRNFQAG